MTEFFDAPRPATAFDHDSTLVVAMELSGKSRQLGAVVPGVSRRPKRGLKPATRPSCCLLRHGDALLSPFNSLATASSGYRRKRAGDRTDTMACTE
jgi:hypothetical protein